MNCPGCNQPMIDGQAFNGAYGCHWACVDTVRAQQEPRREPPVSDSRFEAVEESLKELSASFEKLDAEARIQIDGNEFTCRNLVERAVRNTKTPLGRVMRPRWSLIMKTFAVGSTVAEGLCVEFGLDPEEWV